MTVYPLLGRGLGEGSSILFSSTPCRGAFGGKSTAKPPTRQRSHQTKNSYHSRITRHFVPQTNSAFVVYSFCLIVHFWLLSDFDLCAVWRSALLCRQQIICHSESLENLCELCEHKIFLLFRIYQC